MQFMIIYYTIELEGILSLTGLPWRRFALSECFQ